MTSSAINIPDHHAATLVDPAAYADGRIFDTYAWLRANNPLGRAAPPGFDPFWVVTRYDDIRRISLDNKTFLSSPRNSMLTDKASDDLVRAMTGGSPNMGRSLISMDPPDHMKYRLLTQSWFMPKNLKKIDGNIAEIADRTVEKMVRCSQLDFVVDVALHYPLEVVMSILGVPAEDFPFMLRLTQEIFAPLDPDSTPEGVDANDPAAFGMAMKATIDTLYDYFGKITIDRRALPRDDVASLIANATIDGEPMPVADMLAYYGIIATAGHDTTSTSSAAAMYALATQPNLFRRVKADPALIPRLVEEAIRWATPVKTFMRTTAAPLEFAGRQFEANDWLMLCYASGNRDEAKIQDADAFDIDRPRFEHIAFGYGPHMCLGQHLARRELVILFERLLRVLGSVELAGPTEMTRSFFVNGLKRLPIRYELEDVPASTGHDVAG